jgi:hypothetical protein
MARALRLIVAGKTIKDVCAETGFKLIYLRRALTSPKMKEERARLQSVVEAAYADKLSADVSGVDPIAAEVKVATLEAIKQLRNIMMNARSETARAIAAKEIIELGQLKSRLKSLGKPISDDEVGTLSDGDLIAFRKTVADLQALDDIKQTVTVAQKKAATAIASGLKDADLEDIVKATTAVEEDVYPPTAEENAHVDKLMDGELDLNTAPNDEY